MHGYAIRKSARNSIWAAHVEVYRVWEEDGFLFVQEYAQLPNEGDAKGFVAMKRAEEMVSE